MIDAFHDEVEWRPLIWQRFPAVEHELVNLGGTSLRRGQPVSRFYLSNNLKYNIIKFQFRIARSLTAEINNIFCFTNGLAESVWPIVCARVMIINCTRGVQGVNICSVEQAYYALLRLSVPASHWATFSLDRNQGIMRSGLLELVQAARAEKLSDLSL